MRISTSKAENLLNLTEDIENAIREHDLEKAKILEKKWEELTGSEYKVENIIKVFEKAHGVKYKHYRQWIEDSYRYHIQTINRSIYFPHINLLIDYVVDNGIYKKEFYAWEFVDDKKLDITEKLFDNEYFIELLKKRKTKFEKELDELCTTKLQLEEEVENIDGDIDEMQQEIDNVNYILNG